MKDSEISHVAEPAGAPVQCHAKPSHRILVVDDEPCIRQLSAVVLVQSGYEVDTAEDGAAGWDALHAKNYDLLITDHNMPKVSGVELVKKLRSEDITLPVIMVSGELPTAELKRYPWLQLAGTLLKPFTIEELLGTVSKAMRATESDRSRAKSYLPVMTGSVSQIRAVPGRASRSERTALG